MLMRTIIANIIENFRIFKNIIKFSSKKIKIVFYSENKNYLKYSYLLIETFSKIYPNKILYASSSKDDYIDNLSVKNLYVGRGFFLQYFFLKIKANNFFLTTTDMGNNILKKTKNIDRYIYYFHSAVSTLRAYTSKAFDNYDIILCNGDYQVKEIKKRENLNNLKKKKIIKNVYLYFDYLKKNLNFNEKSDEILIAPSWNYDEKNFINEDFEKIIEKLLYYNYKVRFRPHPEHFKRSLAFLNRIKNKFKSENFYYDENIENINSMEKAKCLITDNSGIAIEFTLILKKPTLYYESKNKIHNSEFKKYKSLENFEDNVKKYFGFKFKYDEINQINLLIKNCLKKIKKKEKKINKFAKENFYNLFNSTNFMKKKKKKIIFF